MKLMERIKKAKENKKGFTLVELIVVLVILAILAAILIPTLTGYIDKANEKKVIAEARMTLMAAQSTLSEYYGTEIKDTVLTDVKDQIEKLAELNSVSGSGTAEYGVKYDTATNKVTEFAYKNSGYGVTYKDGVWGNIVKASELTIGADYQIKNK